MWDSNMLNHNITLWRKQKGMLRDEILVALNSSNIGKQLPWSTSINLWWHFPSRNMWRNQAKWVALERKKKTKNFEELHLLKTLKLNLRFQRYSDFSASQNNEIQRKLIAIICLPKNQYYNLIYNWTNMHVQRTHTKQLRTPWTTTLRHPKSMQCNFNSCSFNYKSDYSQFRLILLDHITYACQGISGYTVDIATIRLSDFTITFI